MSLFTLENILEVLEQRQAHCRDLLDLSRTQNRTIDASDYSSLLGILGQKQRILSRLDELSKRYPDLTRQWTTLRETGDPGLRRECEGVIKEIEAILAELSQTEKEGSERLSQRRDATRAKLESIAEGVHVNETYRDNIAPFNHRFLDLNR